MPRKKARRTSMRIQIAKLRKMLADKELFLSESYHSALWKLVKALGEKKEVKLVVEYEEDDKSPVAFTDGDGIYLNVANHVTRQFESREERVRSHEGLIAHECGHIRCSDFKRRFVYVGGFKKGLIYPNPPNATTATERKALKEMQEYLNKGDRIATAVLEQTAAYLNNVLEDVYIESFMCQEYPGSVRTSIHKNAFAILSQIPLMSEREKEEAGELTIILDMIFRYARAGMTADERGYLKKHLTCLNTCRSIIDEAIASEDKDIRFRASNQLILKLWKYVKLDIEKANQDLENRSKYLTDEEFKKSVQEYLKSKITWIRLSNEMNSPNTDVEEPEIDGWNGLLSRKATENDSSKAKISEGKKSEESGKRLEGIRKGVKSMSQEVNMEGEQTETAGNDTDIWDMSQKLSEILNEAAKEEYVHREEKNLEKALKNELKNLELDDIHKGVKMALHRSVDVSEKQKENYEQIVAKIKKASGKLQKSVEEILLRKEGGITSGLYMGKRLSRGDLYRRDGKIFEKKLLPEDGFSVAFAILVDESGSMEAYNRIGYAMEASLVMYDFCKSLSIPIMVYGHSTDYPRSRNYEEVVDIFAYADFDSVDGKDYLRMMDMQDRGSNRDGAALRFVGEHLLKRGEEIKILIIISDGNPAARGYQGILAKQDLQNIKRDLSKRGVKLFAAAIGDDRAQIESIYKDGFLNISDLNAMPVKLANLLIKYIR